MKHGKFWIIYDTKLNHTRGITNCKDIIDIFKKQRDMSEFIIERIYDEKIIQEFIDFDKWLSLAYGIVLFQDELEYGQNSFDQLVMDIHATTSNLYTGLLPFLKLNKSEVDTLLKFTESLARHMQSYTNTLDDENSVWEDDGELESKYFHMDKMFETLL